MPGDVGEPLEYLEDSAEVVLDGVVGDTVVVHDLGAT